LGQLKLFEIFVSLCVSALKIHDTINKMAAKTTLLVRLNQIELYVALSIGTDVLNVERSVGALARIVARRCLTIAQIANLRRSDVLENTLR
jgi:hypothetical protein